MSQKEYVGFGSVDNLRNILKNESVNNIFLVTGKGSYKNCGAEAVLKEILAPYNVTRFYDFDVNPKLEEVEKGIKIFNEKIFDIVIAIGGGTVMDLAKMVNVLSIQEGKPIEYVLNEKKIVKRGKPLIAIPTTAGTGSEATQFVVVNIGKTKHSIAHDYLIPDYSILDPQFTMNLPPKITASTGIDALCQGVEAYWSIHSTEESNEYAKKAIMLILENLSEAVNNPSKEARLAVAKGANFSGKAINITKTTAAHAVSYPITSFFSVPHGHAVGLTLGSFLVYNEGVSEKDVLDKRGVDYVKKTIKEICSMFGADNASDAKIILNELMTDVGLEISLKKLGVDEQGLSIIIENGFSPDRVNNNPRKLTKEQLFSMLHSLG